ncbi:DUF6531 domain-containing protein [Streptomyces sp. WMMC897]|uniref:DUF6531 domain-containing protein n=1 Tax=Streptomyces sp. WMMC897 TaxID=3014782 RepID=UPI0022B6F84C|nr:DUF6531 domain-containing protein [Streptomyces sp. WMMC897]MCZ7416187.1 DUF6531 domain-containing protein [Streptomyces sp. WMMC897]
MAVVLPSEADMVLDLIGVPWPNVDEDAYRDMADNLRDFADDVEDDAHSARQGVKRLISSGESEALTALNGHWEKVDNTHLKDLASAARIMATALDGAAGIIEAQKVVAVGHLVACAATATTSAVGAFFTFGASTVIGAAAVATCRKLVKEAIQTAMDEAVKHIIAAMAEPAVVALESMATELVVQIAANGLGLQDGVDMDKIGEAGKEGIQDGVQSGQESLGLASADGVPTMRGLLKKLSVDPGEHDRAVTSLDGVGITMNGRTKSRLTLARSNHNRTRGKDDIAGVIDPVADRMMEALDKAHKTLTDHVGGNIPKRVRTTSNLHDTNERDTRDRINSIKTGQGGDPGPGPRGGPVTPGKPLDFSFQRTKTQPNSLRNSLSNPQLESRPVDLYKCVGDPIDVATGQMVLAQTDLQLPGVLPLVLSRTHLSNYRYGHSFGRSGACTLDERLHMDGDGSVFFARQDGSTLIYPRAPEPDGEPVLPVEGPRLPLVRADDDAGAAVFTVTDPHTGHTRRFPASGELPGGVFDDPALCWLTDIEDRNGNRVDVHRDADGVPIAVTHTGGYHVEISTAALPDGGPRRVTSIALRTPQGPQRVMAYGYDDSGNLDAVTNPSGLPLRFTYDAEGRITSWTDRNDSTFTYVYDASGRVIETVGPEGHLSSTLSYDLENRITRHTDSTGATTTFQLNHLAQVVAETDPLGHTTRQEWDRRDHLLSRTDPLGHTTTYTYDDHGNLTAVHLPDGSTSTATYDALNLPVEITGPDGATWRQTYDERGNRTALTTPERLTTRFTHDDRGATATVTDPAGNTQRLHNDPAGLVVATADAESNTATLVRDAFGRPVAVTGPLGGTTRLEWTVEGKPSRRIAADGTSETWTWDGEGNCLSHTDPGGGLTAMEYGHFDKLTARTGPDGVRYEFRYDTELRLTQVLNPQGLTWDYGYNARGLLTSETDFDDRTIAYAHDAAGRLASRTTPLGQQISYTHDSLGRPVTKDVEGTVTAYVYDASGHLIRAANPESTLVLERDVMGRVLAESVDGRTTRYGYDALGRRTSRTTPTGVVTELTYDQSGNRTGLTVNGHALAFAFDALGREQQRSFGTPDSPITLATTFDTLGRPASQTLTGQARTLRSRAYTYNPDHHLTAVTDRLTGDTEHYALDPTGRPLSVTADGWSETYAYDSAGNQTAAQWPDHAPHSEARGERTYSGTRLLTAGRIRYAYDAAGRTTLRQQTRLSRKPDTWRYTWDAEDRLTGCTTPDGTVWRYHYDPLGRRTAKQRLAADGHTVAEEIRFTWDDTRLAEEVNSTTHTALTWDHDGYRPLTQTERRLNPIDQSEVDARFFAIVTDLVGTPTELVDEAGHIAWHTRATLWGRTTWNRDATAYTPLRFPGQYADPETELHYNYFRHYDPDTARYTTPDPLGLAPAPNPVAYVDSPGSLVDPLGLAPCDENDVTWGGRVHYGAPGPGGRATGMHATIEPDMTGGKTNPPANGVAGYQKYKKLNKTHLLGAQIGGSNKDLRNFVTMHRNANSPVMKMIEDQIRAAVDNGETVEYTVTPVYRTNDPTDVTPLGLTLEAHGDRGFSFTPYGSSSNTNTITILNVPKP